MYRRLAHLISIETNAKLMVVFHTQGSQLLPAEQTDWSTTKMANAMTTQRFCMYKMPWQMQQIPTLAIKSTNHWYENFYIKKNLPRNKSQRRKFASNGKTAVLSH